MSDGCDSTVTRKGGGAVKKTQGRNSVYYNLLSDDTKQATEYSIRLLP